MDSTAQTAPRDLEIINELLSRLTHGFDIPNSTYALRYHQRSPVTGDGRIRQPKQPYRRRNHEQTAVTGDLWIRQPKQPLKIQ